MIDGGGVRSAATLDDLFRRAGVRHPHTLALADPPNLEAFTDGVVLRPWHPRQHPQSIHRATNRATNRV